MMKIDSIFILIFILVNFLYAEEEDVDPLFEFGNISKECLHRTTFPDDSTASAAILFDICNITYIPISNYIKIQRHKRIQIYKEDGMEYANITILHWPEDIISDIEACTYLPDGRIKKLKKNNVHNDISIGKIFIFPEVENNCIIEYSYSIISEYSTYLDPWTFQASIPTEYSHFSVIMPNDHIGRYVFKNSQKLNFKPIIEKNKNNISKYSWIIEDLPAVTEEPFITTVDDYIATLYFQIVDLEDLDDWEYIRQTVYESHNKYLLPSRYIIRKAKEIIKDEDDEIEIAKKLFYYVQNNYEDYEYNGILEVRYPKTLIKKKSANYIERNLLLVSFYKAMGLAAEPILISTRNNGKIIIKAPNLDSFNHIIIVLKIKDKVKFLDASEVYCPFDLLPYYDHVSMGFRYNDIEDLFVEIPDIDSVSISHTTTEAILNVDGTLKVKTKLIFTGYKNMETVEQYDYTENIDEFVKDYVFEYLKDIEIDSGIVDIPEDISQSSQFTVYYHIENFADKIEDKLCFSVSGLTKYNKNPFTLLNRTFPVDFPYPYEEIEELSFQLPEKYQVIEMPENVKTVIPGFQYTLSYTELNNTVKYTRSIERTILTVEPSEYKVLRSFYSSIVDNNKNQIVIEKIEN